MILPCDIASSHVSSSSSSVRPCTVPSLSVPSSAAPIFASMEQQQSSEQLMAQYAAHVLRQHHQQQQAKPYSRRTPAAKPYSCEQCGRGFKYLHTLRFHIKTTHDSAAPAVEPRLSRLRRDAQPANELSSSFCGAEPPDVADCREEDLSLPQHARQAAEGSSSRSEPDVPPEFPQDVAPAIEREPPPPSHQQQAAAVKNEVVEPPDSYGVLKSESHDTPTTTSCVSGLPRMSAAAAANLGASLAAAGLPPSSLLGMDAWRSMKLQAEVPLASKVDVVNPLTEQQYTLYKCGICGETHPSLRGLCDHLQAHTRVIKEHHCDKCGAVFKWRSQLLVHEQVHQVMEGKAGLSPSGLPVLNPLPDALIGEPRVSFDQALQLGALAGHFLQPGALPNIAMSLPLSMPGTTSVVPSSTSSMPEFTSHAPPPPPPAQSRAGGSSSSKGGGQSCPSSSQEVGMRLPFQCSYCSKSFDRIFSLQRHERIHTGVKPCYCKACGRGFSERRNLRHHIIRFHSDVSQRDQLRRRRRAAAARSRAAAAPAGCGGANGGAAASGGGSDPAGDNTQGSLKLVSFLKDTAAGMLNSVDEGKEEEENDEDDLEDMDDLEDKGDLDDDDDMRAGDDGGFTENGSPDGFKEDDHRLDGSNPELSDEEGASPMAPEMPVALCTKDTSSPGRSVEAGKKVDEEEGEEDNRTIIYPLDAVPMATGPVEAAQADDRAVGDGPLSSQDLDASNEEVRRPTTGNRRKKGRPMRYEPAMLEAPEDCGGDRVAGTNSAESKPREERAAEDEVNPYSKEEMAAWMQLGRSAADSPGSCENGDASSSDSGGKVGTAGQGTFFSAYNNPRLDVAERPISREEACTPQMGPDGKFVYPCSYCYKTFCSTSDLNRHMDFHEGIRQFLCRACSYHAVTQSDLSQHEQSRQHLVRQQNACPTCGLGFNSRALLGDHALSCGAVRDLTAKVAGQCTEANNNDRGFESRNGEGALLSSSTERLSPTEASRLPPPLPPHLSSVEDGGSVPAFSGGDGRRLEKSCVLLKKKLLCFEGAL